MSKYKLSAAALSAILIGGGLYLYEPPKPPEVEQKKIEEPRPIQGFGFIDLEQIKSKHPDGERLKELAGREKRLKLELEAAMQPYKPPQETPETAEKPFEDSAREKSMEEIIEKMAALRAKKERLVQEFTEDSREEYLRRRNEVRAGYSNEELNITLKLQNAQTLRLTAEDIEKLQRELDEVVLERNNKQREMLEEWTAEINRRVEQAISAEETQLRQEAAQIRERAGTEAEQKIREVQERNKTLTENTIEEIESRQKRRRELMEELREVSREREELEKKILSSITDTAGKLGALYRLEVVLIKREESEDSRKLVIGDFSFEPKTPSAKIFLGKGAQDLTKDLIRELELKGVSKE